MRRAVNHTILDFSKECSNEEDYVFVHGADPQFGFIDVAAGGDGLVWDEEIRLLKKAIHAVNSIKPKPKFFFINGDLVDAAPGAGDHKHDQEKDILEVLSLSEVPVLVTCGNHDIGNEPSCETVQNYTKLFGDDFYSFCVGDVLYIALNSQYLFDSSVMEEAGNQQLQWLRSELNRTKTEKFREVIVFMHIPPFISSPDEEDLYSNLPKATRLMLLNEFADAGVKFVFAGHYHRNAGGFWRKSASDGDGEKKIEVVVTTAIGKQLGNDSSGLTVVTVQRKGTKHQFYSLDDIPSAIEF